MPVHSESTAGRNVTLGTPAAVADATTGTVHLFMVRDFTAVLLTASTDGGRSWSAPRDLTATLVPPSWKGVYVALRGSPDTELRQSEGKLSRCWAATK